MSLILLLQSFFRKHFVCLAIPLIDEDDDIDVENSPTSEMRKLNECEKCREECELRLSTLMSMADQVLVFF